MELDFIIMQASIEKLQREKEPLEGPFHREINKLIIDRWEDQEGNLYYKTYNKDTRYTMFSKNGSLHNIDGPAVISDKGELEWWFEDKKIAMSDTFMMHKFSDTTPLDESIAKEPSLSLDLLTVLKARQSYENKKVQDASLDTVITDIQFKNAQPTSDFVIKDNSENVLGNMRKQENNEVRIKPK